MRYFSGFGFCNEKTLFKEYLEFSPFVVAGFSYGAQKAVEFAKDEIKDGKRIKKLQLLSPFYNPLPKNRKHKEIVAFVKNQDAYLKLFYKRVLYPIKIDIEPFKKKSSLGELKELLSYEWQEEDLRFLNENGIKIEVFLGSEDKIIQPLLAKKFFLPWSEVYWINGAGHLLRRRDG